MIEEKPVYWYVNRIEEYQYEMEREEKWIGYLLLLLSRSYDKTKYLIDDSIQVFLRHN